MVMEKLLEKLRCRTITASNGAEAMRYAMSEIKFDIIMMEFKLPQINGADVARMIRDTKNANTQTPIVAVTGYLKELQAPHHFDALVEKPPTTSKLTEVLCRLCQWKAPGPGLPIGLLQPSGLRQESIRMEDSPTTSSSGYAHMPGSSFRASSREDSISSSLFGDNESFMNDDPVVVSQRPAEEWDETSGLGITNNELDSEPKLPLHILHEHSAPGRMEHNISKQRSSEKIRAKRESIEKHRHECTESGDDEDEELGDANVREKSPRNAKTHRGSKLGIEMMRTNSRGSVVSGSDIPSVGSLPVIGEPASDISGSTLTPPDISCSTLTPPEVFTTPGKNVTEIDLNETPRSSQQYDIMDEPTPRAPSASSNRSDYLFKKPE
jgi:serine/threonine-protein kinase RIM15